MKKFRVWDYDKKKMLYFGGIFNTHPWTETSTFSQYESCPKEHKLSEVMQFIGSQDKLGQDIYEEDK